jgi:hypothetical protein
MRQLQPLYTTRGENTIKKKLNFYKLSSFFFHQTAKTPIFPNKDPHAPKRRPSGARQDFPIPPEERPFLLLLLVQLHIGQLEIKQNPVGRIFHPVVLLVKLHNGLHDGKPQAVACAFDAAGFIGLIEAVKEIFQILLADGSPVLATVTGTSPPAAQPPPKWRLPGCNILGRCPKDL